MTRPEPRRRDAVDLEAFTGVLADLQQRVERRLAGENAKPPLARDVPAATAHEVTVRLLIECLRRLPPAEVAWAAGRVAHELGLVEAGALAAFVGNVELRLDLAARGFDHGG